MPGYPKGIARDCSLRRTDRIRRLSVFQCHCHHGRSDNDDENVIVATKRVEFAVNAVKCTSDAQHVQKLAEVQLVFCCFGPATSKKETSVWPSSVPERRTDQVRSSDELRTAHLFRGASQEHIKFLKRSRQFSQINSEERSAISVISFATANKTQGFIVDS